MKTRVCSLFFVGMLFIAPSANAALIVDPTASFDGFLWTYKYWLDNSSSDGVFVFSLDVSGEILSIASPSGWVVDTRAVLSETLVEWASNDVSFDVPPNGKLRGFQIVSSFGPGTVIYNSLDESLNQFGGNTLGPVAHSTPEPNPFLLIIAGLLTFQILRYDRTPVSERRQEFARHTHGPRLFCQKLISTMNGCGSS